MSERAALLLRERLPALPEVAVVLGSGLGAFAGRLEEPVRIPYTAIPGWPAPSVPGHAGEFVAGSWGGSPILVLAGRAHLYEGFSAAELTYPVRVLAALGVKNLILTCSAGALDDSYRPGQLALICDHINLTGANPLIGPNDERLGPRFPDMSEAYSRDLRGLAHRAASAAGWELSEAVYAAVAGPSYETPAEVRFLISAGADLVGMSIAQEVIAARYLGLQVLAIACVTNLAAGLSSAPLSHAEVLEVAGSAGQAVADLLGEILKRYRNPV